LNNYFSAVVLAYNIVECNILYGMRDFMYACKTFLYMDFVPFW